MLLPIRLLIISEIDQKANESETPTEFNNLLEELEEKILNDNMPDVERMPILLLIKSQQASVEFIDGNQDLFMQQATRVKGGGWWKRWGKCAASILGGAVTGATTLGIAGAGVGTMITPVVGTVIGGVVGVIGGAIGGGLTGAVLGCDGDNSGKSVTYPEKEEKKGPTNASNIFEKLCVKVSKND